MIFVSVYRLMLWSSVTYSSRRFTHWRNAIRIAIVFTISIAALSTSREIFAQEPSRGPASLRAETLLPSCRLFAPDKTQDDSARKYSVTEFKAEQSECTDSRGKAQVAMRSMKIDGRDYRLVVDPETMQSDIISQSCLKCEPLGSALRSSHFLQLVEQASGMTTQERQAKFIQNAGLRSDEKRLSPGSFLTVDLCPSKKNLDSSIIPLIHRTGDAPTPMGASITGKWLLSHANDFRALKARVARGELAITWINHSHTHPYRAAQSFDQDFMLTPGLNLSFEILETERLLIANGVTPSVFFRFPGLVSNAKIMDMMKSDSLITLGSEAWLAKGERPREGSIILIHINGNEPRGVSIFKDLWEKTAIPVPLRDLHSL